METSILFGNVSCAVAKQSTNVEETIMSVRSIILKVIVHPSKNVMESKVALSVSNILKILKTIFLVCLRLDAVSVEPRI